MSAQEYAATGQAETQREPGLILPRSDELLARRVASGGERAFRALYERYHAALYRYCHSILRNEADAQDALQSTFIRALVALREGRRSAPLGPWLYRIAHNESISLLRARRPVVPESELEPVAVCPSAEEHADERARLELLLADLAELAERARAALVMRELGGLSHEEIAAALQISVGAAKQAIFEARVALFEVAEGRAMACNEVRRRLSDGDRRVLRGRQLRAHLRDCASCSAFAAAMSARQAELRALCPALPPAAAAAVLARALHGAGAHGGQAAAPASAASSGSTIAGTGGASAGASSTAVSAAKMVVAVVTPKALLATAVIAGAAAGGGGLVTGAPAHHAARVSRPNGPPALRAVPAALGSHTATGRNSPAVSLSGSPPARTHPSQNTPQSPPAKTHQPTQGTLPVVPGQNDDPGKAGAAPGNSAGSPGNSGIAPGHAGTAPGNSATSPGHAGTSPGNSATPPGHGGTGPGNSATATSRTGTPAGLAQYDHTPPGQLKSPGNTHLL